MQFNSIIFVFFYVPMVVLIHAILRDNRLRNIWLLLSGLLFYGWRNTEGLVFILIYGIVNYCVAWIASVRSGRKFWIATIIGIDICVLFAFKYINFAIFNFNRVFRTDIGLLTLFMPMGISFITFTAIAYMVDVYRGKTEVCKNFFDFMLYLTFFPKAAQGPITVYRHMHSALRERKVYFEMFMEGLKRFVAGLSKKVLIADVLGKNVDLIYVNLENGITSGTAWLGILMYTFQIYFDFSGYTDMAIGIANMLGFSLPENFNKPYLARSVSDFWRRWHMTLGQWFKDYIYIPLGGNRKGAYRTIFNLSVVWLLTGFWHGASFVFISWGVYYGVLVIFEKMISKKNWYLRIPGFIKWAVTFFFILIGWVIFRSATMGELVRYLLTMFGVRGGGNIIFKTSYYLDGPTLVALLAAVILILPYPKKMEGITKRSNIVYSVYNVVMLVLFVISIVFMINSTYSAFIYFQF